MAPVVGSKHKVEVGSMLAVGIAGVAIVTVGLSAGVQPLASVTNTV